MKTPTLKEVKEYFKNAKEVRNTLRGDIIQIDHSKPFKETQYGFYCYAVGSDGDREIYLKSCDKYAEIISYIEPTTEVRNSVLLQLAENNSYSEEILKKECPKLFPIIDYGVYLKCRNNPLWLCYYDKGIKYGFDAKGVWFIENSGYQLQLTDYVATPQEVEMALINEAKKRGYEKGIEVVDIYNGKTEKDTTTISSNNFDYEIIKAGSIQGDMALRDSDGNIIFHNGTWAEIIKTPTDITEIVKKYGKDKAIELIKKL